jgi:endoglucanase
MLSYGRFKLLFLTVILMTTLVFSVINLQIARRSPDLGIDQTTQFYLPGPNPDALEQVASLVRRGNLIDARLLKVMIETPHAVWFTGGDPESVRQFVQRTVTNAAQENSVPVLVPYNILHRDCGHYSAGGVNSARAYKEWIDAFASGIGDHRAIIILEPDSLGIIPFYIDINGEVDWCQPDNVYPPTASRERFMLLNYAVDAFKGLPDVRVYLDATQSRWLGVGDAAERLVRAGIKQADGFALNISNYQNTAELIKFGTWISKCIWYTTTFGSSGFGDYERCGSQFSPASVDDPSTWVLTDQWYIDNVENNSGIHYPGDENMTHFVIDTSRNGQGRWIPPKGIYPDPQDWCNAPGRGLGIRPTADTDHSLVDAYLWIKIPGDSDGECTRGLGPAGTTVDPEWSRIDPTSGKWFPEFALTLARNANPPLPRSR